MPRKRPSELTAGTFVIVCGAAMVAVAVWVGGVSFGGRFAYVTAPLTSGDISIDVDSTVKLGSVLVGKVDRVTPSDDWTTFTYRIRLTEDVDIRQDAVIETSAPTLGGLGSLTVLKAGSAETPADEDHPVRLHVGPNPIIRDFQRELGYGQTERTAFQESLANIRRVIGNLADISAELKGQLTRGEEANMLSDAADALSSLREAVDTVRREVAQLRGQLDPADPDGMLAKVHVSLDNAGRATGEAAQLTANVRPKIEAAADSVAHIAQTAQVYADVDLAEVLRSLRAGGDELLGVMQDLRSASAGAAEAVTMNRPRIDEIVANLTQVSVNIKAASRDIRRQPWKLLGKPDVQEVRSENIQSAADAFADGAAQLDDAITRLKAYATLAGKPVAVDDPQLKQIRQKIKDSFERFTQAEQALWKELAR